MVQQYRMLLTVPHGPNLTTPGYCWYNNDAAIYKNRFGALYNWYVINTGLLAPTGWHVPTDLEWETLHNYLIAHGYNYDSTTTGNYIAKAMAAQTAWYTSTKHRSNWKQLKYKQSEQFFGPFRAVVVLAMVVSTALVATVTGGVLRRGDVDGARNCNLGYNDRSHGENDLCKSYGFSVRLVRDY